MWDDVVDKDAEDDWEGVTKVEEVWKELDVESGSFEEDERSVVGLDVETSCCDNEVVDEEAVRRTRFVPEGVAIKYQYPPNTLLHWISTYAMAQH